MNIEIEEENKILKSILDSSKIGWWKCDFEQQKYIVSDFTKNLLKLDDNYINFRDFIGLIREDYQIHIQKEFENYTNQYKYEQIFPLKSSFGEIWLRSKVISKEVSESGSMIVFGYIQSIPNPETSLSEKASFLRVNNLLYQLNSISHTLLSFLQSDTPDAVINKILKDILKLFSGGRTYIIEYNWKDHTQTCTYEATDIDVDNEKGRINGLKMSETTWWTKQICSGTSIILSSLDDLPEEAASEKEFLALQNIKSLIVVPLISRNGVWGYVGIDIVKGNHTWSNEDCQWFSSLVNIINICMELQKSEQEALTDKVYLQNLYKHMPLGYMRIKLLYDKNQNIIDFLFIDVNNAITKITGYPNNYYIGNKASEISPDILNKLNYLINELETTNYREYDFYIDSTEKHCHSIIYSIQKDEMICLLSDVTDSYNAHDALDRSEKILRNIYDNLPAGIELYNKNGELIDLNNKDKEIFGLDCKEDALGVNIYENPNIPEYVKEKIRNQESVTFKLNYPFKAIRNYYSSQKNGHIMLYTTASMLYDKQGELINYLLINIDNTEISNAYAKIEEFENSFSIVSKYGKIGYCKFDLLTKEGAGVSQWYHNLGEKDTTPLNQIIDIYTYVNKVDAAAIRECIQRVKQREIDSFSKDLRVDTRGGKIWTRINVTRNTLNSDPTKLEMICVNYDITELKETERKLIEAKEKAEVSDRLKSAFLANMSHEIRTPLNAIVGFSNLLIETENTTDKQTYINIIQENNELLLQLISDILDLSKIEAGTFEFLPSLVDVNLLCTEIIHSMQMKAQAQTQVSIEFVEKLPACYIYSDKNRLTQIITNFINNALKFTLEGSISLGYFLVNENEIRFYVKDTGTGIPKNKLNAIFDRFVKLNNFMQGTGLGLSICKSIVEQMGGKIGVESELGIGSTFFFTHPYEALLDNIPNNPEKIFIRKSPSDDKPTILIAEDIDSNYILIASILEKEYTIVRANDGLEAVELFNKINPAFLLIDMKMPKMSGVDAIKEIRKKNSTVPIILITAFDFDKKHLMEAGCNDYMSKPIQAHILKEKIDKLLNY